MSVTYNKADGEAKLYLDNVDVLTIEVDERVHGNDAHIVNSDGGSGFTYKGY